MDKTFVPIRTDVVLQNETAKLLIVQMGSWWETSTASPPCARSRRGWRC